MHEVCGRKCVDVRDGHRGLPVCGLSSKFLADVLTVKSRHVHASNRSDYYNQQQDVLDAVRVMRQRAERAGDLNSKS
jgi:hypothetical protein